MRAVLGKVGVAGKKVTAVILAFFKGKVMNLKGGFVTYKR